MLVTYNVCLGRGASLQENKKYDSQLTERQARYYFGALNEDSIAWKVAEKAAAEGAQITLSNTPMALRMGTLDKLAEKSVLL